MNKKFIGHSLKIAGYSAAGFAGTVAAAYAVAKFFPGSPLAPYARQLLAALNIRWPEETPLKATGGDVIDVEYRPAITPNPPGSNDSISSGYQDYRAGERDAGSSSSSDRAGFSIGGALNTAIAVGEPVWQANYGMKQATTGLARALMTGFNRLS